jgi:hypothetical protein
MGEHTAFVARITENKSLIILAFVLSMMTTAARGVIMLPGIQLGPNEGLLLVPIAEAGSLGFYLGLIIYYPVAKLFGASVYDPSLRTSVLLSGGGNFVLFLILLWQARDTYRRIRARRSSRPR